MTAGGSVFSDLVASLGDPSTGFADLVGSLGGRPDGANIRAVMTNIAGPGHLPSAPYRLGSGEEMLGWAWGQYLETVERLRAEYGRVDLEWIVLRNPLGQTAPGFWTPAFSVRDALAPDRRWIKRLISRYHDAGLKVVLFGNQPHRINRGTMAEPDIHELSAENRAAFGAELAKRLGIIARHLDADAIGFDSFPKPARSEDGNFGVRPWTLGPEMGIPYLRDLVDRLDGYGVQSWAENQPPAGTSYADWPSSMHFAKLGGTEPRGVDDDDPDRPAGDPKDRKTPDEFTELFEQSGVPHDRGWFWLQASAHSAAPTIDTDYGVMVPTSMGWGVTS